MTTKPNILCIGSVLWDTIGRATPNMQIGTDIAGRISRLPGGVAMNVAMALKAHGMKPALLSAVGKDAEGRALIAAANKLGINTRHIHRSDSLPTDRYMAIEAANGLIAAIADAHSLEAAGPKVLAPLAKGVLKGWNKTIALDGNLTMTLLEDVAHSPLFTQADLRIAPASPGKAERLMPFLSHQTATLYLNLEEAGILMNYTFTDTKSAAKALLSRGLYRVVITDGPRAATVATAKSQITLVPPKVMVNRVTGAGDTFMAAHIAAEAKRGATPEMSLEKALKSAAKYISSGTY
jgi:sugar/nucleoside kinase (ribokinase family)